MFNSSSDQFNLFNSSQRTDTSATVRLYTVLFTLVHAVACRPKIQDRRLKLKIQTIQKQNTPQEKQTMQNTAKQNYLGLVAFTTLGQETRWAYSSTLPSIHWNDN